jgi:hypothetical protein
VAVSVGKLVMRLSHDICRIYYIYVDVSTNLLGWLPCETMKGISPQPARAGPSRYHGHQKVPASPVFKVLAAIKIRAKDVQ